MRLFTEADLHQGVHIAATEAQAHYLTTVMRRAAGASVTLFNGRDGEWQAGLVADGKRLAFAVAGQLRPQRAEPDLWLAFAPLKRQATDLLAQKATELGVARIMPVVTRHTQAERVNLARLRLIAIEAAEQCERLSVPDILPATPLAELLERWPRDRSLYVAAERSTAPPPAPTCRPAGLLVGPEGGFAPGELDAMTAYPFVHAVSLGSRILRAETAAIVGLALLLPLT